MIYSDKYKFVFYPIPKNGTSSVGKILLSNYQASEWPPDARFGGHVMAVPKGIKANLYHHFTSVRHPLSRAVSLWHHCIALERYTGTLEEFVFEQLIPHTYWKEKTQTELCRTQSEWINHIHMDQLLRLENLQNDFNSLPFAKNNKLPHENKSQQLKIDFNMRIYEGVYTWAEEDFRKFNYCRWLI